jgi:hypothetical protein
MDRTGKEKKEPQVAMVASSEEAFANDWSRLYDQMTRIEGAMSSGPLKKSLPEVASMLKRFKLGLDGMDDDKNIESHIDEMLQEIPKVLRMLEAEWDKYVLFENHHLKMLKNDIFRLQSRIARKEQEAKLADRASTASESMRVMVITDRIVAKSK